MLIAIYVGLIISSPVWLYQIFAFLVPGLTGKEKRYVFGFFFTAVPLFLAGCAAGWFVLPHIVELLHELRAAGGCGLHARPRLLQLRAQARLAVGVAFVLPVFLVLLNFVGVMSRARPSSSAGASPSCSSAVFTAIATPAADVISMFLLAIPMVAAVLRRRRRRVLADAVVAGGTRGASRRELPAARARHEQPSCRRPSGIAASRTPVTLPRIEAFRSGLAFDLDPFQVAACPALEAGSSVLVAAPDRRGQDHRRRVRHPPRDAGCSRRRRSTRRR